MLFKVCRMASERCGRQLMLTPAESPHLKVPQDDALKTIHNIEKKVSNPFFICFCSYYRLFLFILQEKKR